MNVPPLHITQTPAKMAIEQDFGEMNIEQSLPRTNMNIQHPEMKIEIGSDRLEMDQSQALAAYGLMNPLQMNDHIHAQLPQKIQEIIGKFAQEGTRMANVHHSANVVAELAAEPYTRLVTPNFLEQASLDNVQIYYQPGEVALEFAEGNVDLEVETSSPVIQNRPAQVHIAMQQYPSIEIEWTGQHIDYVL